MSERTERIVPLNELPDFKVADHDPDVRGWEVVGMDGRRVGTVDRLLVDTAARKVRYLDVDVKEALSGVDRHILVPIGHARLDEDRGRVEVDRLKGAELVALPAYTHQGLTRDYESDLRRRFGVAPVAGAAEKDFYGHDSYDDSRFLGGRRSETGQETLVLSEEELAVGRIARPAGSVEVHKEVETRHVRETVPVKHDEVVVERRPAPASAAAGAKIEEEEIRVPLKEEELVVQKRTVPKEELLVRKREVAEHETVEADLRRERAEIHPGGDVKLREERR